MTIKESFIQFIHTLQEDICEVLEKIDGKATFQEDNWQREGGGGGKSRVIRDGNVFEKGGVNTSIVHGQLPKAMAQHFGVQDSQFFACGISLVIHPLNPMIPTVHANYRYFELYDDKGEKIDSWFGGGADLTPYYLWEEDAVHFHTVHKLACDPFGTDIYPKFKQQCDEYFRNTHRNNEARGIGGIFYDYIRPSVEMSENRIFEMSQACGQAFLKAYIPIVENEKTNPLPKKINIGKESDAADTSNLT